MPDEQENQKLSGEDRKGLEAELAREFSDSYTATSELRESAKVWRDQYDGILPAKPQKWSANVNVPLTEADIDAAADQLCATVCGATPIFQVESVTPQWADAAPGRELWLQFWMEQMRVQTRAYLAFKDALLVGVAWLYTGVRRTGRPAPRLTYPAAPLTVDQLDAEPTVGYVTVEDAMVLPGSVSRLALARGAFRRVWLRWADIERGVESRQFYKEAAAAIKLQWAADHPQSQIHEQQGVEMQMPTGLHSATFECWEGVWRWRRPGERTEREWLVLAACERDEQGPVTVLRCTDYRRQFGEDVAWPLTPIIVNPRANSMYGRSMCESIRSLAEWMNATFSQHTDAVTIGLMPPIRIPSTAAAQSRKLTWGPLARWPISGDVQVLSPSPASVAALQAGMNQMEFARQMKERVTGVTDLMQGRPTEEKRTAFEIGAVVESANLKFEESVARIEVGMDDGEGMEAFAANVMAILDRFLPDHPIQFRLRGQARGGWEVTDPRAGQGKYQFRAQGTNARVNPEARYRRTLGTLQGMQSSPFAQISLLDTPELILRKVKSLYTAHRDFYQAMGHRSPEEFIGNEPESFEEAMAYVPVLAPPQVAAFLMQRWIGGGQEAGPQLPTAPGAPGGPASGGAAGAGPAQAGALPTPGGPAGLEGLRG